MFKGKVQKRRVMSIAGITMITEPRSNQILNYKFHEIINAILLSGSIFLSGTKFFIDPPDIPEALEKVTPWVSRMFKL